jgi:hypothetical protein
VAAADATGARVPAAVVATESPSSAPSTSPSQADAVSAERAREIALERAGGGSVTEVEREQEHGRPVWSVEIRNGSTEHEVDVDRETGAIVKAGSERDDDHGREDSGDAHGLDDDGHDDDHGDDD